MVTELLHHHGPLPQHPNRCRWSDLGPPALAVKLNEINTISSYPHSISSPQLPVLDRWSWRYYTIINPSLGTQTDADSPISVPPGLAVKLNENLLLPPQYFISPAPSPGPMVSDLLHHHGPLPRNPDRCRRSDLGPPRICSEIK